MKKNNEIPIGEIGIINGVRVMAKEYLSYNTCNDCCFSLNAGYRFGCPVRKCNGMYRNDKTHVYFVEVKQ